MTNLVHGTYAWMVSDTAFKKCFGTEEFKAATLGLLNSALPGAGIIDVEFDPPELQGLSVESRKGVIDVLCKTKDSSFIIEMQNAQHSHFLERTVFYSSLYILNQSRKGEEWDFSLKDTFVISFLNFTLPVENWVASEYFHHYVTKEKRTGEKLPGSTEYLFFELKRFEKTELEVANDMEKWLYLLKHSGELSEMPESFTGEGFEAFEKAACISSYTSDEMLKYEKDMVTELDRKMELKETKERAYLEGREDGKAEGRAEGEANIAKALLASGMSADEISRITGLPQEAFC